MPTCPGSTRIVSSRITTVASAGSSPVNVKWYVASSPAEACRWNRCGRANRNDRIDLGRRPPPTRRGRLCGNRRVTYASASEPGMT